MSTCHPEGKTLCSTQVLNTLRVADRALNCGSMTCGNCCAFPESLFQGNTIQACGMQGVTAEMDWHPEAMTNSYSMDHLTHSVKGMSGTPQDESALGVQSTWALQPQQPTWLLCPAFPLLTKQGKQRQSRPWPPAAGSQEHPAKGQQDGMVSLTKGAEPSRAGSDAPAIHCHPPCTPAHNCFGVRDVALRGMHSCRRGHATKELLRGHQQPTFLGLCALTAHAGCRDLSLCL